MLSRGGLKAAAIACSVGMSVLVTGVEQLRAAETIAPPIKLSRGGICHDPSSQHYARLKEFQPYNSVQECIAAGGRLTRAATKKTADPSGIHVGWWVAGGAIILLLFVPWLLRWKQRWHNRRTQEAFEVAEEKRWRGHQLPPKDDGPGK